MQRWHELNIGIYTKREPRIDDNKDTYKYISKKEFETNITNDFFIQYNYYKNNYYGIAKEDLKNTENDLVLITGKDGINILKQSFPDIISMYINTSVDKRIERMIARGDTNDNIYNSINADMEYFEDIKKYIDVILDNNESIDQTIDSLSKIITNIKKLS